MKSKFCNIAGVMLAILCGISMATPIRDDGLPALPLIGTLGLDQELAPLLSQFLSPLQALGGASGVIGGQGGIAGSLTTKPSAADTSKSISPSITNPDQTGGVTPPSAGTNVDGHGASAGHISTTTTVANSNGSVDSNGSSNGGVDSNGNGGTSAVGNTQGATPSSAGTNVDGHGVNPGHISIATSNAADSSVPENTVPSAKGITVTVTGENGGISNGGDESNGGSITFTKSPTNGSEMVTTQP